MCNFAMIFSELSAFDITAFLIDSGTVYSFKIRYQAQRIQQSADYDVFDFDLTQQQWTLV